MKFRLIYGRSGSGKSKYIYEDITRRYMESYKPYLNNTHSLREWQAYNAYLNNTQNATNFGDVIKNKIESKNIFIIVPEQSNLTAEKKLFEVTNKKSLINIQVLTLKRSAYRVQNEISGNKEVHLSKVGKDMLIYHLLTKYKKDLKFLGKSDKNIEIVNNMFTELKKHNVGLNDLDNVEINDKYTKLKLDDIKFLYEKYQERLENNFIDENDALNILAQNLDKSKLFESSLIYIDEFLGFTPQEYKVFEKLIEKCDEMTVTICLDNLDNNTNMETDIFYFNKVFARKLIDIANKNGCEIEKIKLENQYRFKSPELRFLEKNLYQTKEKFKENVENVKIFLASNPYSELEYVAKNIHNLVKNCGYHYNEIGVITQNIDSYSEDTKVIFSKYDIPLFIDEKKSLNQNILIKYIIAMLNIFSENWSFDSMFNYLKIGLLDIPLEDIYTLENYCKKWGIRGSKWHNKEFGYEPINETQEKFEDLRKRIVEPLINFKNSVSQNRTAEEISKEIYNFLVENNINEILDKKLRKYDNIQICDEYNTSYKILINVLEELVLIFKNEKITFEKYKELLQIGLNSSELGTIPATQDQVILGDTERTRSNNIKIVFIIGINDGNFPQNNKVEGYLNDKDREILKQSGIELAKTSIENLYEDQFNIYRALSLPEEKLYLTYCSSDKEGKSLRPSILIKKIKRLFENITQESDVIKANHQITNDKATFEEALNIYKEYLEGENIEEEWETALRYFYNKDKKKFKRAISGIYYTNKAEEISEQNINKLYGNTLKTSVSRLENYRKCPFSFHLTYGLKLKEKENMKIETIDTGSFMHEVIDLFFEKIDEENLNVKQIEKNKIQEIVSRIIDELLQTSRYYIFSSSAKFRLLTRRLKKVVIKSIEYIVYTLKYSDFKILGHEIEFSNSGQYKPIEIKLEDNKKIEITGKIDRVDIATLEGKKYIRVIDYKSSIKKVDLNQVQLGLQIQLLTYLDALSEVDNFESSGILYLGLIDNIVKADKNLSEEEIEKELRKKFKMQGLILADVSVVKMMDNKLQSGSSDIVPVYIGKDGELSEKRSSIIKKDEFQNLQKQVKEIVKQISREILKGKIDIKPYSYNNKTGCDYCKYKTICMRY